MLDTLQYRTQVGYITILDKGLINYNIWYRLDIIQDTGWIHYNT